MKPIYDSSGVSYYASFPIILISSFSTEGRPPNHHCRIYHKYDENPYHFTSGSPAKNSRAFASASA